MKFMNTMFPIIKMRTERGGARTLKSLAPSTIDTVSQSYKLFKIIDQRSQHETDFSQGYYQIAVLDEAEYHNEQLETLQNILPHWFRCFTVMV